MTEDTAPRDPTDAAIRTRAARARLPNTLVLGVVVALAIVVTTTFLSYRMLGARAKIADQVTHTLNTIEALQSLLGNLRDAELGQRGYVLTRADSYLVPYTQALALIPNDIASLRQLLADSPRQLARVEMIENLKNEQLDALRRSLDLLRDAARPSEEVLTQLGRGKVAMDRIRAVVGDMRRDEQLHLDVQQASYDDAVAQSFLITIGGASILAAMILFAGYILARNHRERATVEWMLAGQAGISEGLLGERRLDVIGERALGYLARYVGALAGTIYLVEEGKRLRRIAWYARSGDPQPLDTASVAFGEGLLGEVAKSDRAIVVSDVPPGYMTIASGLGQREARELVILPVSTDGTMYATIELGFFHPSSEDARVLAMRIAEQIAIAIRTARDHERVETLLSQTLQQSAELQAQQEELRVSNEELEEQSSALKVSQTQLENQQAELEQTNAQLEEQAQQLEQQADDLLRAQTVLVGKADELEKTNQYKSEFLANMSHELRTPLNSTLILAKLLAENKNGNLTPEQIKFAETISSAGNDLLALINDILDLSKIEAGKVEVGVEAVDVARLVESLVKTFEPVARQKQLDFTQTVDANVPATFETDPQRVAQILRNLLSNAIKFTENGTVSMTVTAPTPQTIAFVVADSGIGISEQQQQIIFEAFRQADGSTHRRYGGTGLGLSISRNLARLLGGDIGVDSEAARGSRFTLTLPLAYRPPVESPVLAAAPIVTAAAPRIPAPVVRAAPPAAEADDRERLVPEARRILVIEDDVKFADILKDVVHECGFQCIVTHSAGEGLDAARKYQPSAILLDMHLPDHSGLGVLDQLKRDPATRHIPVHVSSVADYSKEARELGAIGYDLKPVARDRIVEAVEGMRSRIARRMRRVLIVEDDVRQLNSLRQLLAADGIEIVGVARADEALAELQRATFDCMVMDLNLPDLSGYELLERMTEGHDVAFPPVIVYTGRMLSGDEEQRLARHSRSIIIKDARSPERLLDEVTLFLHQVEADLPADRQRMLREARRREAALEGRRILLVEDDVRNVFAVSSVLEPKGALVVIARNGIEALARLAESRADADKRIDLVLMDIMMPEMDGLTAMREIRKDPFWKKLPIVALTAKAMRDDHEQCLLAGANDYIAKPLDVEKLLSLIRVWMPKT